MLTHDTAAIRNLQSYNLFEIGLHPNFLQESTQGTNPKEVMTFLTNAFPNSKTIRTHGLVQSTHLLAMLIKDFDIEIDLSLFLVDTPNIIPHQIHFDKTLKPLLRIPYFWEDDVEGNKPKPCWKLKEFKDNGLKIYNFHPIHIVLNSPDTMNYERLKKYKKIHEVTSSDVKSYVYNKNGSGTLFNELVQYISLQGGGQRFQILQ